MSYSISHKTGIEACRILSGAPFLSSITRINADIRNNAENRRNYTRDVAQEAASKRKTDAPCQSEGKARKNGICAPARAFHKKTAVFAAVFIGNRKRFVTICYKTQSCRGVDCRPRLPSR